MGPVTIDPNSISTFEWLYQHSNLVTYPVLIGIIWRLSGWFRETQTAATKAVSQIDKMATEYFPAMRDSLKTQDASLTSMDSSLKTIVQTQVFATAQPARRKRRASTNQPAKRKSKK